MHPVIIEDLQRITGDYGLDWASLAGARVLVTGASGFLPSYMVQTLLHLNDTQGLGIEVVALVRNEHKARQRFNGCSQRGDFKLSVQDVCDPIDTQDRFDYIIHAASQATPKFYGSDPVGTLKANTLGTYHSLELARTCQAKAVLFFSSGEVYGRVSGADVPTPETCNGNVDPLDVRSCYAESKRAGETMCVCYWKQHGVPAKIVRPFHTYGPGLALDDGRVFADFVADIVADRNIALKSDGAAQRAFCYIADATAGFFRVLLAGEAGQAYNVGNDRAESSIRDLAELLVRLFPEKNLWVDRHGTHAPNYLPSKIERNCPDISKIRQLGWEPRIGLQEGFQRTIRSFQ